MSTPYQSTRDFIIDYPCVLYTAKNGNTLIYETRLSRLPPEWRDDRHYIICDPRGYGVKAFRTEVMARKFVDLIWRGQYHIPWRPGLTPLWPVPPPPYRR